MTFRTAAATMVVASIPMLSPACASLTPTGMVRVHNATHGAPICAVQIGPFRRETLYEQRIEPGTEAEFPARHSRNQQAVNIKLCNQAAHMTQNVEFAQGANHLVVVYDGTSVPDLPTPPGYARYDLRNPQDTSRLENLDNWQGENGVKADWVFFSLVNRCKRRVDYKVEPGAPAPRGIDPEPADGYKFWAQSSYREAGVHAPQGTTLWLRDGPLADWREQLRIEPASSKRLEITKDCKKIVERTDDQRYHGCYAWAYSAACPKQPEASSLPAGCPAGTPGVEGDTSRRCEFETDKGTCTIVFRSAAGLCDRR